MLAKLRKVVNRFLNSNKQYPTLAAIAAGLYPIVHYYNNNLLMANSWLQFAWFLAVFVLIPVVVFNLVHFLANKFSVLRGFKAQVLTGLNLFTFGVLMLLISVGVTKMYILLIGLLAMVLMFLLSKHLKKIVILQLLMVVFTMVLLIPKTYSYFSYSEKWTELPDSINEAQLKKKPNIYIIQPDGYTNFSALSGDPYNYNNEEFKTYLKANEFDIYDNNRSNYFSTLTSNASLFAMKQHYFLNPKKTRKSYYDYRKGLAGDNNATRILKNNGYKTFTLLDYPYIIINRPKQEIDVLNYDYNSMSYLGNKWKGKEPLDTLEYLIKTNTKTSNFFFIEKILPTHIENLKSKSEGVEGERTAYFKRLEESNIWLKKAIDVITKQDKNGIIVLVSDHGGYVGLEAAEEVHSKQENPALVNSIFSSLLAIKWSNNKIESFEDDPISNVNLFRVLFSHLSENKNYLDYLEDNSSYQLIKEKAPFGVYKLIDTEGKSVFENLSNQ